MQEQNSILYFLSRTLLPLLSSPPRNWRKKRQPDSGGTLESCVVKCSNEIVGERNVGGNLREYREDSEDSFNSLVGCYSLFHVFWPGTRAFPPIVLLRFYEWMDVSFLFFFFFFLKMKNVKKRRGKKKYWKE